ncbi:hypothetical protein J3R30DRAFT_1415300 [Lentinula aciculospora]|uniref:Uncharacterized protein n=1 Tax=Lentinula aciculospora TaxID=153920 RepID=A0A9W9DUN4_9AGAR|nr:hypothetical protein J3R30DRAFT_1415300 [Lentinula aciculospora]
MYQICLLLLDILSSNQHFHPFDFVRHTPPYLQLAPVLSSCPTTVGDHVEYQGIGNGYVENSTTDGEITNIVTDKKNCRKCWRICQYWKGNCVQGQKVHPRSSIICRILTTSCCLAGIEANATCALHSLFENLPSISFVNSISFFFFFAHCRPEKIDL